MKHYIQKLFGLENRPIVIADDTKRLQTLRQSSLSPSDDEPEADISPPNDLTYGHAEGQTFGIVYEDAKGNLTERYITVWSIKPGPHCLILNARCNLRERMRTFRVDRIDSVFDYDGEVYDVYPFLEETFGIEKSYLTNFKPIVESPQFDSFPEVRSAIRSEAILLAGLSLADGSFCDSEIEVGARYLNGRLEKLGFLLSHQGYSALSRYYGRMRPGSEEIEQALHDVAQLAPDRQASFIASGLEIIKADGVITDLELQLWNNFVEDLTGLSFNQPFPENST